MYETRGSYWNCIETIIYYPIHALSFRANFPRIFPFPRIRFFEKRKPGRDRIAPPTMNESLSIRVGREPNVNRRKRKKGAILNENRRGIADRRERERGGQCCGLFDVLFQPKGVKTCASFFPDPYSWPDDSIVECICINSALKPI